MKARSKATGRLLGLLGKAGGARIQARMNWKHLVLLFAALGLAGAAVVATRRDPGPLHHGRSVAWWLERSSTEAEGLIDSPFAFLPPEAAPVLAAALLRKDTTPNSLLCAAWNNLPSPAKRILPEPVLNARRRRAAAFALLEMKDKGRSARFALAAAASSDSDARVRELSAAALARLR